MATSTITKVTSYCSTSGAPSVPNATPATEFLGSDVTEPPPPMDFAAVTKILAPITETLNDSADEAMLPSPPINTPIVGSPTPSVSFFPYQRARGFSAIGDRLAKLKLDNRKIRCRRDAESVRSDEPSVVEDCDCEVVSISEVVSDGGKGKCPGHVSMSPPLASPLGVGSVPIALGSPTVNPRIEEYLSFTSKDLPTQGPEPATGVTLAEHATSTSTSAIEAKSFNSRVSFKSDGVTEKSNWAEELEESVDRTCLRLEQLAKDEHNMDPSKTIEEYYVGRLARLLGARHRFAPVKIEKLEKMMEYRQKEN
jgi:hypothetical protein